MSDTKGIAFIVKTIAALNLISLAAKHKFRQ